MPETSAPKPRRRILFGLSLAAVACLSVGILSVATGAERKPRPRLGINLAGPCDWNTELPFVDLMHFSRAWTSQKKGLPFGTGPALDLDENGYPTWLNEGAWAESPLISFGGHPWPSGNYTVLYKGRGKLSFGASATGVSEEAPGRMVVSLDSRKGDLHLSILETDPRDPVRDIHVIMPGFEKSWSSNPWNPLFLGRWRGVACIRFMDFMATNNSAIRTWTDRPRLSDSTFAGRGVPLELLIDLSNRLHADPWFCIPHMASDDFVRSFAAMVSENLDPSLKAHIEYSTEVWNPGFEQNKYAAEKGLSLGLAKEPWEAAWLYTSKRSVEIFRIFEQVFGGRKRLARVLPAQSGNTFMARKLLDFEKASGHADALAIAPYVGLLVGETSDRYNPLTADVVEHWDVPQVLDRLRSQSLPEALDSMREFRELAASHGLDLIAYEGGQHLVGIRGAENNSALTGLFMAANSDPGMGTIYNRMLEGWQGAGGSLFCHFSSVSKWSKWGSWGTMQYFDDEPADSPKLTALVTWAKRNGQAVGLPAKEIHQVPARKNIDAGK
ncbi:MAG: hypothetical protein WCO94_04960 [Verrucomicrobiota bacterium]